MLTMYKIIIDVSSQDLYVCHANFIVANLISDI